MINRLCDLSLVYGYAQQSERIDVGLVKAVVQQQHLGATLDAARQRATAPASAVKPVVAAMEQARGNDNAAEVLIEKIDSILATGAQQEDKIAMQTVPVAVKDAVPLKVEDVVAEAPVQEAVSLTAPESESESDEIHPGLRPKIAREDSAPAKSTLHTLVVNAEKSANTRSERGAMWLFLSVAVMVIITAWVSRDAWLPDVQDVAVVKEPAPSEPLAPVNTEAGKAARLARQQAAERAKQEQAKQEKAQREKASRLARQ